MVSVTENDSIHKPEATQKNSLHKIVPLQMICT